MSAAFFTAFSSSIYDFLADGIFVEEALEHHILGKQWIKRLLEPSEIGKTAVFLASDGAGAITGESIPVTGGM